MVRLTVPSQAPWVLLPLQLDMSSYWMSGASQTHRTRRISRTGSPSATTSRQSSTSLTIARPFWARRGSRLFLSVSGTHGNTRMCWDGRSFTIDELSGSYVTVVRLGRRRLRTGTRVLITHFDRPPGTLDDILPGSEQETAMIRRHRQFFLVHNGELVRLRRDLIRLAAQT